MTQKSDGSAIRALTPLSLELNASRNFTVGKSIKKKSFWHGLYSLHPPPLNGTAIKEDLFSASLITSGSEP